MIAKDQMITVLVDACPTFESSWHELVKEWEDEPVELPIYLVLGDFARHVISMLEHGDTISFPKIFQAIELLHVEGEAYVKQAATIGILEGLQNAKDPDLFRLYLGTESTKWWDKLNRFWNGDVTEGRPVVQDELVVGALGSQITAAPRRSQAGVSAEDRYLVCCKSRQSESRDVRLVATAPSGKQLTAQVHFVDVVVDETPGSKRYFPGYQVQVRDWQTCDEGRCEPG